MILPSLLIASLGARALAQTTLTLPEVIKSNSKLSFFSSLLQSKPEYVRAFAGYSNTTCFIPQNEAFVGFPSGDGFNQMIDIGVFLNYSCVHGSIGPYFGTDGTVMTTYLTNSSKTQAPTGGQRLLGYYDGNKEYVYSGLSLNAITAALNIKTGKIPVAHDPLIQKSQIVPSDDLIVFNGGIINIIDALLSPPIYNLSTVASIINNTAILTGSTANLSDSALSQADDMTLVAPTNDQFEILRLQIGNGNHSAAEWDEIRNYSFSNATAAYPDYFSTDPAGTELPTQLGIDMTLRNINDSLWIDSAKISQWNILLPNGILYLAEGLIGINKLT